ncbi:MAG TPA: FtsX-like permease family protein [Candidatus Binataceae bacterium]|nr:FtsX-like permease family protein [Candidatus Binataceae bacterium]
MKYAALIFKNLFRSKRRTLLTVVSIAVSLFIFSVLVSIPTVADQILGDSASSTRIATHNKAGLAYPVPIAYVQRIRTVPHVDAIVAESWFGGVYHEVSDQFPNLAVDPDQVDIMWSDWNISKESVDQFKKIRTACLIGVDTAKRFNLHVGQQIMLRGTLYPFNVTLDIVGTVSGKAPPSFLIFRRDYLEEAAGQPGFVDNIWVKVDRPENVASAIAAIDAGFANSSAETISESEATFLGNFMESYRTFFRMAELLGFIVVLTIGLVAANTAAMSIRERRNEIAVMRSIGFPSRTILSLLISESLLIGVTGGLIGCAAAYGLLKAFSLGNIVMGPFSLVRMPPSVLAGAIGISILIGFCSAIVPATSAVRRNIVDALRMVA